MDGIQLEKLYVLIEAQTSEFNSQMTKVNSRIDGMSKSVSTATKKASGMFSTVGKSILAAFSIGAIINFGKKLLEMSKQTEVFKNTLAQAFTPLANTLMPVIEAVIKQVAVGIAYITGFIQAVFDLTGKTEESAKSTVKAAAAVKRSYAGFDELNTLSEPTAAATELPEVETEGLVNVEDIIAKAREEWAWLGKDIKELNKTLGEMYTSLGGFNGLLKIAVVLSGIFAAIWIALKWDAIITGLQILFFNISTLVGAFFDEIILGLSPLMMKLQYLFQGVGQWFFGFTQGAFGASSLAVITGWVLAIIAAFAELWITSERFRKVITTMVNIIKGVVFMVFNTLAVWIGILFGLVGRIAGALYELYQNSLKPVVEVFFYLAGAIATLMAGAFGTVLLVTINLIGGALAFVLGIVLAVVEVFNSLFKAIAEGNPWAIALGGILLGSVAPAIIAATTALWGMVSALAATTLALIKQIVQWGLQAAATIASSVATAAMTVATWLLNTAFWANPITWIIAGIVALIAIFVWAYQEFEVFRDGVNGIWEGIKQGFKGLVNFVIDGINAMITALNSFKFNIPKWVPVIGGKDFSLNIPLIPRLAEGGMPDAGSLFVAGEAGAELIGSYSGQTTVMPLENSNFTAAMGQAVYNAMTNAMANSGNSTTTLVVDGMTLAKAVESNLNKLSTVQGGLKIAL